MSAPLDRRALLAEGAALALPARAAVGLAIPGVVDSVHGSDALSHSDPTARMRRALGAPAPVPSERMRLGGARRPLLRRPAPP